MTKNPQIRNFVGLVVGLVLILFSVDCLASGADKHALVAGYCLFAFNYLLLAQIYQSLISIRYEGKNKTRTKIFIFFATLLKFGALIGALYIFLVKLRYSGFYLALGSLGSLLILTVLLLYAYFKVLSQSSDA